MISVSGHLKLSNTVFQDTVYNISIKAEVAPKREGYAGKTYHGTMKKYRSFKQIQDFIWIHIYLYIHTCI